MLGPLSSPYVSVGRDTGVKQEEEYNLINYLKHLSHRIGTGEAAHCPLLSISTLNWLSFSNHVPKSINALFSLLDA